MRVCPLAGSGLDVPRLPDWILPGLRPQFEFLDVRAGLVAPGDERRSRVGDQRQRLGDRPAGDSGRVRGRADDHEVVVHHQLAAHPVAGGHERPLGLR